MELLLVDVVVERLKMLRRMKLLSREEKYLQRSFLVTCRLEYCLISRVITHRTSTSHTLLPENHQTVLA